jgi:hypothetical protein
MAITDVIKIKEMVKAKDKGERLEEELQMTEKIEPRGYSSGMPHGDGPYWNQQRRTPEDQYQSQREVLKDQGIIEYMRDNQQQEMMMNYLIEMFNENPTKFEQQFGNEASETMRMMQGFSTKGQMEEQGTIFEPGTSEIIGQKASFSPDQVALGTLPTDQSEDTGKLSEFFQSLALNPRFPVAEQESISNTGEEKKSGYQLLIDDYVDAYSEIIGYPGDVLHKQRQFDKELLEKAKDMKEYRQLRKDTKSISPIGKYLWSLRSEGWEDAILTIENKFEENRQKFIETKDEEVTPYREGITEMNEDISGILKNLPKEMWHSLLDTIKPYYLDENEMRMLHPDVDFDKVLKEERLIERGSEDWNKLQQLDEALQKQVDERWTRE